MHTIILSNRISAGGDREKTAEEREGKQLDRVRAKLHAEYVHKAGFTGRGVTAAILDTGISRHPDYAGRILAFGDFVNGKSECYDDASHGTHVSGILAGDGRCSGGRYCGIAPGCRLIHLKVLDRNGQGSLENILAAIHWVIKYRETYGIRILNISAGTTEKAGEEGAAHLVSAVEMAWDKGLVVVTAAGNMGPHPMTVTAPGNSRKVITVGAADRFSIGMQSGNSDYSGCGPTRECICKPEVVAPGTDITSCSASWNRGRYYTVKSGTSMASPAIAGAVALLLEQKPELTNVEIKMRLKESARDLGMDCNRQGWGMPDLRKLLRLS